MPKLPGKHPVLAIILVSAYVYYVWVVARALTSEADTDMSSASLYNSISRFCFGVASWFGSTGIEAELKRDEILERGRMI